MMASCLRLGKKAMGESTIEPNWLELPRELTANILQRLGVVEIVTSACRVCSMWWNICKDPLMWRTIDMDYSNYQIYKLENLCRYVIDRSCGHLEDISIKYFASDDFLKYIADSTSHLRRLRLPQCESVSNKGLVEAAKKLPLLEELHDISFGNITRDSLKAIGQCCPHLKTLKFSKSQCEIFLDEDAFAIAETMPKLCYLQIPGNYLTDKGLHAIVDGCRRLEYLDLGHGYNIDLTESLRKMWSDCRSKRYGFQLKYKMFQ